MARQKPLSMSEKSLLIVAGVMGPLMTVAALLAG